MADTTVIASYKRESGGEEPIFSACKTLAFSGIICAWPQMFTEMSGWYCERFCKVATGPAPPFPLECILKELLVPETCYLLRIDPNLSLAVSRLLFVGLHQNIAVIVVLSFQLITCGHVLDLMTGWLLMRKHFITFGTASKSERTRAWRALSCGTRFDHAEIKRAMPFLCICTFVCAFMVVCMCCAQVNIQYRPWRLHIFNWKRHVMTQGIKFPHLPKVFGFYDGNWFYTFRR